MNEQVNTAVVAVGACVLGIALIFAPDTPPLAPSSAVPATSSQQTRPETPEHAVRPGAAEKEEQPAEPLTIKNQEPPHKEVLGKLADNLQAAREEFIIPPPKEEKRRLPQEELYAIASNRVVNLFCELERNEVAIATGVLIHENGYILTNAHVVDGETPRSCLIRRGSPARNFALAERVFQPIGFSASVTTNKNLARDIAIWKITKVLESETAIQFPALAIRPDYQTADGTPLATFSYPAELLGSHTVVSALYLSFSETIVESHDAYFIESSQGLGSQKGSSGGILLDPYTGAFAGLIFAINDEKTADISKRKLFSLTPFAVNEAVRTETGKDIAAFLAEHP